MASPRRHVPVLLAETVDWLAPAPGATIVDATLGAGGHAEALLEALAGGGRLLGIDRDPTVLGPARERLARFGAAFTAIHGRHEDLAELVRGAGVESADGILFDLGVSTMQLDDAGRGFSFRNDGPLDMRMDPDRGPSAAELLARCEERELARILRDYGEEKRSAAIARAVVREREIRPLTRTRQLAELVERTLGARARRYRIHPATRSFQALRIAVNGELAGLGRAIDDAVSLLAAGGRVAVISYHSLEDRIVKHGFRALAERCVCPPRLPVCGCGRPNRVRVLTRRPVRPAEGEIEENPRARSARLRVAERLEETA